MNKSFNPLRFLTTIAVLLLAFFMPDARDFLTIGILIAIWDQLHFMHENKS